MSPMEAKISNQTSILLKLSRLLLGSGLIFVALNSGPPRVVSFDSFSNFLSFTFFGALFFLGFYLIGFLPESKIKKRLQIASCFSRSRRYLGTFLVFYGIFLPGLTHVNKFFQDQNASIKYSVACFIFFIGLLMLGFHVNSHNSET